MKYNELKKQKIKELKKIKEEKEADLGNARFLVYAGKGLKSPNKIKQIRQDLARISTAITYRRTKIKEKKI
jgi:ribosomal protein L29